MHPNDRYAAYCTVAEEHLGQSHWISRICRAHGCRRAGRFVRTFAASSARGARPSRTTQVVTGGAEGFATPVDAAPMAVAPRDENFAWAVAAVAAGDAVALAELYDSTVAKVDALVKAIVRNPADSEEVTCEVYTQAWQTAVQFDPSRGSVMTWLM